MNLLRVYLLMAVLTMGMALPAAAQAQDKQATPPLVQLLQSKGILFPDEAAQLSQLEAPTKRTRGWRICW